MNSNILICFCLSTLMIHCYASFINNNQYTVVESNGQYSIVSGSNGLATGVYNVNQNETGWNFFTVEASLKATDDVKAYAAGFLEGGLTNHELYQAYMTFYNSTAGQMGGDIPEDVYQFIQDNINWLRIQSTKAYFKTSGRTFDDEYWSQVYLVMRQFDGLVDGFYQYTTPDSNITYANFLLFEYDAEVSDILTAVNLSNPSMDPKTNMFRSHCSSFVKVSPDGNLHSAHVSWESFDNLLRIYKNYNMPFELNSTKSVVQTFSSYPGYLPSGDDWYVTDTGLSIAETTNGVFNVSLYQYVTPVTVPYWIRCIVATRMAFGGEEWSNIFAMYNSGTYNNQWIIVDYKLYSPGQPLQPNTLWIAEQIPGYVISGDQTATLQQTSYWASYNIPFYSFVYNISGWMEAYEKYGDLYSHAKAPRAQIFARDHHTVVDAKSMQRIMRYNKWQTDPLSLGDSCNGISARCDLDPPSIGAAAFGGVDCKITSYDIIKLMKATVVAGPTWDSQPVFAWTEQWSSVPHFGEVQVYNFEFIDVSPDSPFFGN